MRKSLLFISILAVFAVNAVAQDIQDGLVFYLPCDAEDATDLVNEVEGEIIGSIVSTDGHLDDADGAFLFDGASYIKFVDAEIPELPVADQLRSYSFWVKTATMAHMDVISYGTTSNGLHVHVHLNNNGILKLGGWNYDGVTTLVPAYNDEAWHHIVMVMDETEFLFYFDNEMIETFDRSTLTNTLNTTLAGALFVGARNNAGKDPGDFINGALDDIRAYNRVLADDDVDALFNYVPVSVNELSNSKFKIYPTTTNSMLNIESNMNISSIELINISGKVVKTLTGVSSIDVSDLKNGIYFLKAYNAQGNSIAKFIKK